LRLTSFLVETVMASPALYWTSRASGLPRSQIIFIAQQLMASAGLTDIKASSVDVGGRTTTVHAVMAPVRTNNPPPVCIVLIVAAGAGAKQVRDQLAAAWDSSPEL
jgi:hypothetical protein